MKHILIFNDISGLGNCSMAANLPIFTKLGHYCMPVVTATFSCQTGFGNYTCQQNADFAQCVVDVLSNRTPDAVYVGFCAETSILQHAGIAAYQTGSLVFVDPILGDNGSLYPIFNQSYVSAMKKVVVGAQCISPNLTEACMLADVDYDSLMSHSSSQTFLAICGEHFKNFLQKTGAKSAVITGVPCGEVIGNIVLEASQPVRYVTNQRVQTNFSGTGDVFSSVLLGELLCGATLLQATQAAANFVAKAAQATICPDRRFGIDFPKVLNIL